MTQNIKERKNWRIIVLMLLHHHLLLLLLIFLFCFFLLWTYDWLTFIISFYHVSILFCICAFLFLLISYWQFFFVTTTKLLLLFVLNRFVYIFWKMNCFIFSNSFLIIYIPQCSFFFVCLSYVFAKSNLLPK